MESSITTSIRMPASMKAELDLLASHQHKKKNQIILQALSAFLKDHPSNQLMNEAKSQCQRANQFDTEESDWDELVEDSWADQ